MNMFNFSSRNGNLVANCNTNGNKTYFLLISVTQMITITHSLCILSICMLIVIEVFIK